MSETSRTQITDYCRCGKKVRIKKDGTPVKHRRWGSLQICRWSGKNIKEILMAHMSLFSEIVTKKASREFLSVSMAINQGINRDAEHYIISNGLRFIEWRVDHFVLETFRDLDVLAEQLVRRWKGELGHGTLVY